jgi:hypothetical protein
MSTPSADDLTTALENTVYTAVGLGILGYQHLQVRRRELQRYLTAAARLVGEQVEHVVSR